jgi:hypothetical protein
VTGEAWQPLEWPSTLEACIRRLEPAGREAMLRLELISGTPEPAAVTAPRVMVGQRIGGVATNFVQGY